MTRGLRLQAIGIFAMTLGICFLARGAEPFVVHEWGVTVTGVPNSRDVLRPPTELIRGLPAFVLRHEGFFTPKQRDLGWDKPVIHFYGGVGTSITVTVGTPVGTPLAYWPIPSQISEREGTPIINRKEMIAYTLSQATGMTWTGTLSATPTKPVSEVDPKNWWHQVREVPSAWLNTAEGSERFIFYEATAKQLPVVQSKLKGDDLELHNTGFGASGPVVAIVNDGATRLLAIVPSIAAGKVVSLNRKIFLPATDEAILAACRDQWRTFGMTEAEATAIVQTWKPDLLHRVGFIVAARLPETDYQLMFPLSVSPKPDEVVRAGVVFDTLPGQDERLSWLPALRDTLENWSRALGDPDFRVREPAARKLENLGDLAKPYLIDLKSSDYPEVRRVVGILLKGMESPATQPVR